MKIEIETSVYNEKRYGQPWIARVTFDESGDAQFQFGNWVGRAGYAGILILDAEPGDIVARGQKDYRKPRSSSLDYYRVEEDGTLTCVGDKADAYREFKAAQAAQAAQAEPADPRAALLAEREALLSRLAEIDQALGIEAAPAPTRRTSKKATAAAAVALLGQLPLFPELVM